MICWVEFSVSNFNAKHRTIEPKMVKYTFFFFKQTLNINCFNPSHCFSPLCFVFPLELIFKNQTAINTERSRWWGCRVGAQGGPGLPRPCHPGSVSATSAGTQYPSFHQAGPWWELGPWWRLGLGTSSTKPPFFLPRTHGQEYREGWCCRPHGVGRGRAVGTWAAPQ